MCLAVCGACGIAIVFVNLPMVAIYLYVALLLCGLGINVLSAATVELYPTKLRYFNLNVVLILKLLTVFLSILTLLL